MSADSSGGLTIPEVVDNHDGEKHAEGEEEDSVDIVGYRVADLCAESEEKDAADYIKGGTEEDIAEYPSVIEGTDNKEELRDDVDNDAKRGEHKVSDE